LKEKMLQDISEIRRAAYGGDDENHPDILIPIGALAKGRLQKALHIMR
jgi:hypothetical protein